MIEILVGLGICVCMASFAGTSNRSPLAWFGLSFGLCAVSLFLPLPFLRFMIVGLVVFLAMLFTNKA